jgi:hypothetical protein
MALIVEDGSVVAGAESYGSVAEADAYFTSIGISTWTGTVPVKEAALRKATAYIDTKYGQRLKGYRKSTSQVLRWPRVMVEDDDVSWGSAVYLSDTTIPTNIKRATFEAALRSLTAPLDPDLERGGAVQSISVAGAISKTYFPGAPSGTTFRVIDRLMAEFVFGSSGTIALLRS